MKPRGFTIVELFIVIVVIGILAAITIVAFNGVQTRANNTAKSTAVSQIQKLIQSYVATYDRFPLESGAVCASADGLCTNSSGTVNTTSNATLMTELRKVGEPPRMNQAAVGGSYGVQYIWEAATVSGNATQVRLEFWMDGTNVNCGVNNVVSTTGTTTAPSTTGYTASANGRTNCWVRMGLNG